jgi:glycosyltransferase involved in cell wall biosynthesis
VDASHLRVLQISHGDGIAGAARAAYRIHRALVEAGVVSRMRVRRKGSDDWTVNGPTSGLERTMTSLRGFLGAHFGRLQRGTEWTWRSLNVLPSRWATSINQSDADVAHLHWVNSETISIEDLGRIAKPLVMTLHDMWAFCGAEHYAPDGADARWRLGYSGKNRARGDHGMDLDRWTWRRKCRAWRRPVHVLCPSRWLAECARASVLMRGWSIAVLPCILDTGLFRPLDRGFCRAVLGLPAERRIVLFGALGMSSEPRKGYDLLLEALQQGHGQWDDADVLCVVFGEGPPRDPPHLPMALRWLGRLHDEVTLPLVYGAADVMVVPSRQDNLVQTGTEAQSCGCPVVGFAVTGMPDVVEHGITGYLATPYDTRDLARGIAWVLADERRRINLGQAARRRALGLWSPEVLVPRYLEAYQAAIALRRGERQASNAVGLNPPHPIPL